MSADEATPSSPTLPSSGSATDAGTAAAIERIAGLSEFAGKIAHDFNNVLATISGSAALLEMGGGNPQRHIRNIHAAAERGARMMRQLLALSPKLDGAIEPTKLDALLAELATEAREALGSGFTLNTFAMPELGEIPLDRPQTLAALQCLLDNARDAMPAGGSIMVTAHPVGADEIGISVHDNGTGIPAAVRPRIFEPFFSTKPKGQGNGLGLPVALRIVQRHGGRIIVRSEPTEGTVFTCVFPRRSAQA